MDFKNIIDTPYYINREGQVKRLYKNGKETYLKPHVGKNGYAEVAISYNDTKKKRKKRTIHRLLGIYFIPNVLNKPYIDHRDRNKLNNKLSNLRWVSVKENNKNRILEGSVFKTKDFVKGKWYYGWRACVYTIDSKKKFKRFKKLIDAEKWRKDNLVQRNYTALLPNSFNP
tara:strand:+ start:144 stop:656 length:513 start_codon:yes stop_codon:yes gene_type:complete